MKYNGFLGLGVLRRQRSSKSMEPLDATAVAQLAVKLGLVTPSRMEEVRQEVNGLVLDAGPLLRQLERKGYLTPWQSNKLLKGEQDGYFLGGYRVLYKIASGSFGRVFRAEDNLCDGFRADKADAGKAVVHLDRSTIRHLVYRLAFALNPRRLKLTRRCQAVDGAGVNEELGAVRATAPAEALDLGCNVCDTHGSWCSPA